MSGFAGYNGCYFLLAKKELISLIEDRDYTIQKLEKCVQPVDVDKDKTDE